ncbi:MAG: alcohol dehydrogenase catalytic domain-containing protein [Alphaproteobacteria bacterium]|nr:alcohol dehydrogenase catalytic domain-containing protein [Alphaproteobacteria bacterium]MCB9794675.1 alcohol dehydrogenase catalytic domain-containing protein [Alphaproteobacteria bacterium]
MNRALVKDGASLGVRSVPVPTPGPGEVRLRVRLAGICRTDIAVAEGRLECRDGLVLGHECCAEVERVGPEVEEFRPGQRVAVDPWAGEPPAQLGVWHDGAFARYLRVPADRLVPVPEHLSEAAVAFVEPVAAALAVLTAPLPPGPVWIPGEGRLAELTRRVLRAKGVAVTLQGPAFCAVETDPGAIPELVRGLHPGGTLVLKSRPVAEVRFPLGEVTRRRLVLRGVWYGDFDEAVRLLASGALQVEDLAGPRFALRDWAEAFALAQRSEAQKVFLDPWR